VQTCTQCGAQSPPEATWCGACYLLFSPPVDSAATAGAIASALPPVGPDAVIPPQVPHVPVAVGLPMPPPPMPQAPLVPPQPTAANPPEWPHGPGPVVPGPNGWGSPPTAPADEAHAEGRLLSRRALVLVSLSIALGGAMQLASYALSFSNSINQDTLIRVDLVLTLLLYAIVGSLIVSQITPNIRLRWGEGPLAARIANGAVLGLGLGAGLLAIASAIAGHLDPDPRIVLLMSGGDPTHVIVMALLTVAVAPLVEEILFRGLLLESLRGRGTPTAVIGSALFFAVWHFIPAAIPYYTALGAALGGLYIKRGLTSSMAAHACFNGVLTVAAIVVVLGPGHTYDVEGLSITAPSGWNSAGHDSGGVLDGLALVGPDASGVSLNPIFADQPFNPDLSAERLRDSPDLISDTATIDATSIQEVQLPGVGEAVEAGVKVAANSGELYLFGAEGHDYVLVFVNGGSAKAARDFTKMLDSLRQAE
jgi:membrane protease YdiL (CAAX protease family)